MTAKTPPSDTSCSEVRETLRARWLESPTGPAATAPLPEGPVGEHLETCTACRSEAEELTFIDASLEEGFRRLSLALSDPAPARIEETVRRLRERSEDAELIRKVRRPIRILLWITFYFFALLACFVLARAVLKVKTGG
jgi:hypothetical protein